MIIRKYKKTGLFPVKNFRNKRNTDINRTPRELNLISREVLASRDREIINDREYLKKQANEVMD